MTIKNDLKAEFERLKLKQDQIIDLTVADMFSELKAVTPVDTSQLKNSWVLQKGTGNIRWQLINNQNEYNWVIFRGLTVVNGKTYGSKKLPNGLQPYITKWNLEMSKRLK